MPGIADSPNSLALPQSSGSVQQDTNITPAVGDFMKAFREGFITTDDITKRIADKPLENAQRQQALADTSLIRPKQREVAGKQLDIQSASLDTAAQAQPKLDEAALLKAQEVLTNAQQGDDKNAILNFYQTVGNPGQLPPKLHPDDPNSDYDYAKIQETNQGFLNEQRRLTAAKGLGQFLKTYTVKEKTAQGGEKESVQRINELTGEKVGGAIPIGESAPQISVLRGEYNGLKEVHNFREVASSFNKLNKSLDPNIAPTPLNDQAAIFSWMKLLDPGSTVREGEYASVKNAAGVPDKIMNFYNRARTGQILTPEQRKEMKEGAVPLFEAQIETLAPQVDRYLKLEQELGQPGGVVPVADAEALKQVRAKSSAAGTAAPSGAVNPETPVKVNSPAEAPPTAKFIQAPDGRVFRNPNYRTPTP